MAQVPLEMLHDYVLLKRLGGERETEGGIIIPEAAQGRPNIGLVLAVGPGRTVRYPDGQEHTEPMQTEVGMTVIHSKFSGSELFIGDAEYVVIKEADIVAIKTDDTEVL